MTMPSPPASAFILNSRLEPSRATPHTSSTSPHISRAFSLSTLEFIERAKNNTVASDVPPRTFSLTSMSFSSAQASPPHLVSSGVCISHFAPSSASTPASAFPVPSAISPTSVQTMPAPIPARHYLRHDDTRLDPRRVAESTLPAKRARKACERNEITPSTFRPHVPADRRVLLWTSPYCHEMHLRMLGAGLGIDLQAQIFQGLLRATTEQTREAYGAGPTIRSIL
ncbi:hypothetical protein B0H17DRAFT_1326811 [Mycena rosella]|uniref:Uncharacterized protein n=1 Tax=Mycena rosella TaxID=1033263 RepID=A0AAD7M6G0_MYCRO|nr:hypothetical protein B0H17DRAFT_1326811 [Mycena rosella]